MSGSILEYRGQEAYWAALCAMDGLEMSDELPDPENADAEIDAVWDFVVENCEESEIRVPSKQEAILELKEMIVAYVADMQE